MVISHILVDTGVLIIGHGRGARRARFIDRGRLLKQILAQRRRFQVAMATAAAVPAGAGLLAGLPWSERRTLLSTAIADVLPEASEILKDGTSGLFTLQFPNHSLSAKIRQVATRLA